MQLERALACEGTPNPSHLWLWQCLAAGRRVIIRSCVRKEMLSPCRWCWLHNAPRAAGFFANKPADPLGSSQSWSKTWKLVQCHRHCDPQPGYLDGSQICAVLGLSFPEVEIIRPRTRFTPVGSDHSYHPVMETCPKGNIQYVY